MLMLCSCLQGWQPGQDGKWHQICMNTTRSRALRLMQALVLAGADASPVLQAIQEEPDADLRLVFESALNLRGFCSCHGWGSSASTAAFTLEQLATACLCVQGGSRMPDKAGVDCCAACPVADSLQGNCEGPTAQSAPSGGTPGRQVSRLAACCWSWIDH